MILIPIILIIIAIFIASIPAGEQCPECNKHFTSRYKAKAEKLVDQKKVLLEFSHCHFCHHKWNITEDGKPIDIEGNYL